MLVQHRKVVQIQQQHRPLRAALRQNSVQPLKKLPPIRQPGQRVRFAVFNDDSTSCQTGHPPVPATIRLGPAQDQLVFPGPAPQTVLTAKFRRGTVKMQLEFFDVRHGRTLGSPLAIEIRNSEWFRSDKWHEEMSPAPGETRDPLTQDRPGHADLVGMQKYGFTDARDVLERASAREPAARVAAGAVAKLLLAELGTSVISHVLQMGSARNDSQVRPTPSDLAAVDTSEVRCFDSAAGERMITEIKEAAKDGDSLGGIVEVLGYGVPVGLGSHVHWDRKIDAAIAQAVMSIQAVKGVEKIGRAHV